MVPARRSRPTAASTSGSRTPDRGAARRCARTAACIPGPVPYTDALVALTATSGKLLWYDQVTKHDVRDYDFEASPIVVGRSVFGAGKAGRVVAWDRITGKRLWSHAVGTHLHDLGPLPRTPTTVCPGLWGGVLTPMAYAAGRLFVPSSSAACARAPSTLRSPADLRARQTAYLVALSAKTGQKLWSRRLGRSGDGCATVAGDVVFAPTLDRSRRRARRARRTDAVADASARGHQRLSERRGRPARSSERAHRLPTDERHAGDSPPTSSPGTVP